MLPRRTVLFLGAGASVPHGYPVTANILQRIWKGLQSPRSRFGWRRWAGMRGRQEEARQLSHLLGALFPGLGDGVELNDSVSIVDVISIIDQMVIEGRSPSPQIPEHGVIAARRVLGKAINGVLQGTEQLRMADRLSQWALRAATEQPDSCFTVVTTNYDTTFETPLFRRFVNHGISIGQHVDFGMPWRDAFKNLLHLRPAHARLALLKLHGSLNWLRCELCGHVTINVRQRIASLDSWSGPSRDGYNVCWCKGLLRSLLVTPSVVRDVRDASLLGIWKAAVENLRMANEWIFVGYSLPAEDIAIRSLLLRAWHSRRRPGLRVRVIQYETGQGPSPTYQRYRLFFPQSALKDKHYHRDGVNPFVDGLDLLAEKALATQVRRHFGGWSDKVIAARAREKQAVKRMKAKAKLRSQRRTTTA